jgi:tripartite-type tricarboxylate transporter receptor subunit TctC
MRTVSTIAAALLGAILVSGIALAQDYPTRPITLVVPFPAGGGNDSLARAVAERMSRTLGQQGVVETRAAGGGGTVATRAAAKAAPDGYTILLTYTGTLAVNPTLYPNAGYDPRKDFAPIGLIGAQPSVLTIHPSLPIHSTAELVTYAKANPNKINCGFVPGTIGHMTTELFAKNAGFEIARVPYKGNGTAIGDLIGGHINMMCRSRRWSATFRQESSARSPSPRPSVPSSCPMCRRSRNRRCPASRRPSVTGSRRRPARRARSSTG